MRKVDILEKARRVLPLAGLLAAAAGLSASAWALELTPDEHTAGLWHFNEGSGEITEDAARDGNHSTIDGPLWTSGMWGSALAYDGVDDHLRLPPNADYDANNKTVEAWFRADADLPEGYKNIVGHHAASACAGNRAGYDLSIRKTGSDIYALWQVADGNGYACDYTLVQSGPLPAETWHHVAGVQDYDNGKVTLYVNGVKVAERTVVGYTPWTNSPIAIGRYAGNHNEYLFKGVIDEIRISTVVRTPEEIAESASRNERPIADAGPDQIVSVTEGAALDGTGSSDPEGEPLTHTWYEDSDGDGILEEREIVATGPNPALSYTDADIAIHYYQLVVRDETWDSASPDTVAIAVAPAGEGRPEPNTAMNVSQMKIHWVGANKGTLHFELPRLPKGAQDDLLPSGAIVTIEMPTRADPSQYAVGQAEVDFNARKKLWDTLPR
ncbi:MAG: LamG-like jellyroll fold domain-containing protein [Elusimicrobiota bacterium]